MKWIKKYIDRIMNVKDPAAKLTRTSLGIILLSTVVMGLFISYYLSYQLQHHNADAIASYVRSYVRDNYTAESFTYKHGELPIASDEKFTKSLKKMKVVFSLLRIKVLDPYGKIIASDYEKFEGVSKSKNLRKAIESKEVAYQFISIDEEHADPARRTNALFEIYIPIMFNHSKEVKAVFEVYKSKQDISQGIYLGWLFLWLFAFTGGAVIYYIFTKAITRAYQQNKVLQYELIEYSQELESNIRLVTDVQNIAILGLSKLAEYRDKETGLHLERMSLYSKMLAEELANWDDYKFYITKNYIESIYTSSVLHDIGKVGIPDNILLKPGKLTVEEFEVMKTHTTIGGDAIAAADRKLGIESFLTIGKELAYGHHEKYNGTGYPNGLKGDEVSVSARIVALADVFDAVTSKRVYKPAFSFDETKKIILDGNGTHFHPDVVKAFLNIEKDIIEVADKYKDTAEK